MSLSRLGNVIESTIVMSTRRPSSSIHFLVKKQFHLFEGIDGCSPTQTGKWPPESLAFFGMWLSTVWPSTANNNKVLVLIPFLHAIGLSAHKGSHVVLFAGI